MTFSAASDPSRAGSEPAGPRLPVLYIGGMGRSGSTLLERLAGQLPTVCNLGEVVYLFERGAQLNERCGCGEIFADCPFWTKVGHVAFGGWDGLDLDRVEFLRGAVEDVKFAPRMLLPRSGRAFDGLRAEYTDYLRRVYGAALQVSGATTIVDSSKRTGLAYALSHEPGIDLRLLHLVRDPRGVTFSWMKRVARPEITDRVVYMPQYNAAYSSALWSGHNALLAGLRLRGVPTANVTYEGFINDPRGTLTDISRFLGDPDPELDFMSADGSTVWLEPTHSVAGNPMRFQTGELRLSRDELWRTQMPVGRQRMVAAISLPVSMAFGYRPWARTAVVAAPTVPAPVLEQWPSVTAVVPSHGRPELLRTALRSILDQDYPGRLDVVVVHDREAVDDRLAEEFAGRVRAIANTRTPGLSGARNTGILAADSELVAFCDDDDQWLPGKLRRQVERLSADPGAVMASTSMVVNFAGTPSVRVAGTDRITHEQLLVSRMAMLHSSSFLLRRDALLGELGLLDEQIPGSMGEDWDLLLRAARLHPIAHQDEPLVEVLWGSTSFFSRDWRTRMAANEWFLQQYPRIREQARGVARLTGQNAFFAAAGGDRRRSVGYLARTLRRNPVEPRAWLALPVLVAPGMGETIMAMLHRRGRGI